MAKKETPKNAETENQQPAPAPAQDANKDLADANEAKAKELAERDPNMVYVKRKAHPDQKNKFTTKEWGLLSKDKDGGKDGWVIDAPTPSELQK